MAATIVKRSRTPRQIAALERFCEEGRKKHILSALSRREENARALVGMQRVWARA